MIESSEDEYDEEFDRYQRFQYFVQKKDDNKPQEKEVVHVEDDAATNSNNQANNQSNLSFPNSDNLEETIVNLDDEMTEDDEVIPLRRTTKTRNPVNRFTYDELGKPRIDAILRD